MHYGDVRELLLKGGAATRRGWNGQGMFVILLNPILVFQDKARLITYGALVESEQEPQPGIFIMTADRKLRTWAPSASDAMADDWEEAPRIATLGVPPGTKCEECGGELQPCAKYPGFDICTNCGKSHPF